jgi:hypothetical protein
VNRRSKHELLPNQISAWKAAAIANISAIFSVEKGVIANDERLKFICCQFDHFLCFF